MKKIYSALVIILLVFAASMFSQEDPGRFEIGIKHSLSLPQLDGSFVSYLDDYPAPYGNSETASFAYGVGLEASYYFCDYFFVTLDATYTFPFKNKYEFPIYGIYSINRFFTEEYQSLLFGLMVSAKLSKGHYSYPFIGAGLLIGTAKYSYRGPIITPDDIINAWNYGEENLTPFGFIVRAGYKMEPLTITVAYSSTKADLEFLPSILDEVTANQFSVNLSIPLVRF